jgi:hypothetical protein
VVDGKPCGDEQELEVETFWEGGWCAHFETPDGCTEGHVWTAEEIKQIQQDVIERAVEPPDPDDGDVEI